MNKKLLTLIASVATLSAQAQQNTPYTRVLTPGDFDGDGEITVADMTHMVSIIAGVTPAQKVTNAAGTLKLDGVEKSIVVLGDMNGDNKIDEKDLLAQLDITLGKAQLKKTTLTLDVAPKDYSKRDQYGSMKDFVNRIDYPNFKVAAAVNADKFIKNDDNLFNYAVENLDEVVADNAMKMGSVVRNNGSMNFNTVTSFVDKATEAGLNVYGHALAWHSQQPVAWLSSLIADPEKPIIGETVFLVNRDFSEETQLIGGWGNGSSTAIIEGVQTFTNPEVGKETYSAQAAIDFNEPLEVGRTYTLKMKVKASVAGQLLVGFQNPTNYNGCGDFSPINIYTDWKEVTLNCKCTGENAKRFIFSFGHIAGTIKIDDLQLYTIIAAEGEEQTLEPLATFVDRDFSSGDDMIWGWDNNNECLSQKISNGVLTYSNTKKLSSWQVQSAIDFEDPFEIGQTYTLKIKVRSNTEGQLRIGFQNKSDYLGCGDFTPITLTSNWKVVTRHCTCNGENANRFLFSFGDIVGDIEIDYLKLYIANPDEELSDKDEDDEEESDLLKEYIADYDFSDNSNFIGWGNASTRTVENGILVLSNPSAVEDYKVQTAIDLEAPQEFQWGETYVLSMKIRSDVSGIIRASIQKKEGYVEYGNFGNITLSPEWETVTLRCTISGEGANRFLINHGNIAGDIEIDDFELYREYNPYALTMAEKKEILTQAMKDWINNMMQKTKGKVKAWDMINEAISGGGNVNGFYDLQHFEGFSAGTWDVGGEHFFWQDYFGSEEYGVIVEKLAREAYANVEGTNSDDLKLFINDYNLESKWDGNQKLKSLIYWIGVWEKGGAKIDGIGTQMHINYYTIQEEQESQKNAIVNMFKLMAGTGKYVRISELDMGICDRLNGTVVTQPTEAQHRAMAEYYQWIIEQYLTIVPKNQQWGICQWCLNDPTSGGWREGEPVGIHDDSGNRKDSYVGWAEGLKTTWQ